jgi:hypothetical protein
MTFEGSTESELRQQLREAWQQLGELQWQLQAEQQNSRRQDRLLASQEATISEGRDEHEQALADRDQEIADLEDEHQGIVTALENERRDGEQRHPGRTAVIQKQSRSPQFGLEALGDVLQASALQSQNSERAAELHVWLRCVRIARDVEDELDGGPAGPPELEAIFRRVVGGQDARRGATCAVEVDVKPAITPRRAILCAWLVDRWMMHVFGAAVQDKSSTVSVSMRSVETPPEIRIRLSCADVSAARDPNLSREPLQPCVIALQGYFDEDASGGTTIAFPTTPQG